MKSFAISLVSLTAVATAAIWDDARDDFLPAALRENPTRRVPITIETDAGDVVWGEFISLMERQPRQLQSSTAGEGFGNDPTSCTVDGEYFNCNAPNVFSNGPNVTQVVNKIRCLLDSAIGPDFQARPDVCTCSATLTEGSRVRECACAVCPYGRAQAVSLDCSVVPDDPFVAGPCSSLDCDARCNGTGPSMFNQPTPAPAEPETASASPASAAPASGAVNSVTMVLGLVVGTAVSFVSVYWV